jgi:hypothetical protein
MTRYNDEQLSAFPWIVSCDTLKTETLLVKFWGVAEQLGITLSAQLLTDLTLLVGEDSKESDWNDQLACDSLAELSDALNSAAPDGFHFSSQDGDGACFGFWLQDDWVEALDHIGLGDWHPEGWASLISELIAGGIDPETIEDAYQGQVEGVTEERAGAAYAEQLADELGDYKPTRWPHYCIDWDQAWRELRCDGYWLQSTGESVLGGSALEWGDWLVFRSV